MGASLMWEQSLLEWMDEMLRCESFSDDDPRGTERKRGRPIGHRAGVVVWQRGAGWRRSKRESSRGVGGDVCKWLQDCAGTTQSNGGRIKKNRDCGLELVN